MGLPTLSPAPPTRGGLRRSPGRLIRRLRRPSQPTDAPPTPLGGYADAPPTPWARPRRRLGRRPRGLGQGLTGAATASRLAARFSAEARAPDSSEFTAPCGSADSVACCAGALRGSAESSCFVANLSEAVPPPPGGRFRQNPRGRFRLPLAGSADALGGSSDTGRRSRLELSAAALAGSGAPPKGSEPPTQGGPPR